MRIGVDLGGTTTAAALVDDAGNMHERITIPSDTSGGEQSVVTGIINVCTELINKSNQKVKTVGIGVPGHVNDKTGEVVFVPNLPIQNLKLAEAVQEKVNIPIYLGNDANCAALGELISGSMVGAKIGVFVILGTGVGGGIIIDGKPFTGRTGGGGELGHSVIVAGGRKCGCGRLGCWEAYSNSTGLAAITSEIAKKHPDSLLWQFCGDVISRNDGREIFKAFRAGDYAAELAVERYVEYLAVGLANMISIFEPEIISLGGGISNAWDCLEELLQIKLDAERYARILDNTQKAQVVKAVLGDDAGIIGAANLGMSH
jgi:glucokinase